MGNDLNRSVKIYIDQSDALRKMQGLSAATDDLRARLAALETSGKGTTREANTLRKSIEGNEVAMEKYAAQVKDTERVLRNLSGATRDELVRTQKQIQKELNSTARGTQEYRDKLAMLHRVQKESAQAQAEMNSSLGANRSIIGKVADGFNRYFSLAASAIATITGLSMAFRKLAEDVAHMDDVYADVRKTTGMTREQVVDLNEEFKKWDTRTAREDLNKLATDAGKLGVEGKQNILDFVEAGNQIRVALGEDLGEDAIKDIGKITEVFKQSTSELNDMDLKERMLAVGSAINTIGQTSSASEPYLVEFTKRLSGVASQAGINVQNILGYASALDQSGQAVEMSATALQNFIMKIFEDPAKFAKIAGEDVKQFTDLLKTDANAAILQVLQSLHHKGGFDALIPIFNDMGLDGARAVGVLSSMATNISLVTQAQATANKAFAEGTSLTNEYNIKNDNLQARLDKSRKAFKEAALSLGERLSPALLHSTNLTTALIKALAGLPEFLREHGKTILAAAAAFATYTIAINASTIAHKAHTAAALIGTKVVKGLSIALHALKSHPFILLASAVAAAIVYFSKLGVHTRELTEDQKRLKDAVEATKAVMGETGKLQEAVRTLDSLNRQQVESLKTQAQQQYDILREKEVAFLAAHKAEYHRRVKEIMQMEIHNGKKAWLINQEKHRIEDLILAEIGLTDEQLQAEKAKLQGIITATAGRLDAMDKEEEEARKKAARQAELAEQQIQDLEKYKQTIEEIRKSNMNETELENLDYEKRLKDARLYGLNKEQMTREQLEIYEILTSQHLKKLADIEKKQKQDAWKSLLEEFELARQEEDLAAQEKYIADNAALDAALQAQEITEKEYLDRRLAIAEQFEIDKQINALAAMEAELAMRRQYGQDTIALEQAIADARIRLIEAQNNKVQKAQDKKEAEEKKAEKEAQKRFVAWKDMKQEEKEVAIETAAQEGAAAVEGAKTIKDAGKAVYNVIRSKIKNYLMEATAAQIAKVITKLPFPINMAVAAAAGAAVSVLFDQLIPEASTSSGSSGSSGSDASADGDVRRSTPGAAYASGGYTGHGGVYEPAGIVHRGEYVVPQYVMRQPEAINHVRVLESFRVNRNASLRGYATGGMVTQAEANDANEQLLALSVVLGRLEGSISTLNEKLPLIRAYVLYQEVMSTVEKMDAIKNEAAFSPKKS